MPLFWLSSAQLLQLLPYICHAAAIYPVAAAQFVPLASSSFGHQQQHGQQQQRHLLDSNLRHLDRWPDDRPSQRYV